jgi:hypothetical protein
MWKKSSMANGAARAGKASRTPKAMQARRAPTGVVQGSLTTEEYLLGVALPPRDGLATQGFVEFLPLTCHQGGWSIVSSLKGDRTQ